MFSFPTDKENEVLDRNIPDRTEGTDPGPVSAREADVREEAREASRCFFNDLCRLNRDRPRGTPSKEYKERERPHDVMVSSYVSSYDVSNNPRVVEGESIQSVKKNRHTLVDQWWHYSSGRGQDLCVANEWSSGLTPTVFQKAFQVNSEPTGQGVGEDTGGDGKQEADEDEHRRYD